MADVVEVIKGLEEIQKHLDTGYSFAISWKSELIRDALELLKEYKAIKEIEEQDDDYDPCYECRGLGDDYIINDDGELESWCDKCGVNPDRMKDEE